jgi:SAM-dependent methyltransferase
MKQTTSTHYGFARYMNMSRWSCYYTQIHETLTLKPETVLEIGPGDGLYGWYMQKQGITYAAADHADDIAADFRVNLGFEPLPIPDKSFDVVSAFQVLEHIPWERVDGALSELARVTKKHLLLDIPQSGFHLKFALKIPTLPYVQCHTVLPRPTTHVYDGFHYWEVGKKGYSPARVRQTIKKYFVIEKEFSIFQKPQERFYVLSKRHE